MKKEDNPMPYEVVKMADGQIFSAADCLLQEQAKKIKIKEGD